MGINFVMASECIVCKGKGRIVINKALIDSKPKQEEMLVWIKCPKCFGSGIEQPPIRGHYGSESSEPFP
jgi:DnaJ-class molecular chaperone